MVACVKLAVGLEFAGQEPARERHSRNDGDLTLLRLRQKQVIRPLTKHVVDDLDADDARIFERFQSFLDFLDAHPMEANLAFPLKTIHRLKSFRSVVGFDWRAVQLHEVERVNLKRLETILDEWREVGVGEQRGVLLRQPAADFSCDDRNAFSLLLALLEDARDQALRRVVAIDVGGVEKIDALIRDSRAERLAIRSP